MQASQVFVDYVIRCVYDRYANVDQIRLDLSEEFVMMIDYVIIIDYVVVIGYER